MHSEIKKYEIIGKKILKIEFYNPNKNNALSLNMLDELISLLERKRYVNKFNLLVFCGYNNGPYSSGADLDDINSLIKKKQINTYHKKINKIINLIENINLPLISFIRKYCYGAGLILALQSDILFADKQTKFCIPASKLKIEIPSKQINNMKKKINVNFLKDILITSRIFSGEEAYNFGIINYLINSKYYIDEQKKLLNMLSKNKKEVVKYYLENLKG